MAQQGRPSRAGPSIVSSGSLRPGHASEKVGSAARIGRQCLEMGFGAADRPGVAPDTAWKRNGAAAAVEKRDLISINHDVPIRLAKGIGVTRESHRAGARAKSPDSGQLDRKSVV